jgi:hypothetical protein
MNRSDPENKKRGLSMMLCRAWWREGVKEEKSRPAVTSCKDPQ